MYGSIGALARIFLTNGVKKEMIAGIQSLLIPVSFVFPVFAGKFVKKGEEMGSILFFLKLRILETVVQAALVVYFPDFFVEESTAGYMLLVD